jgi:phosphoadenosine phosphosulfate reductase
MKKFPRPPQDRADESIARLREAVVECKTVCYANSLGPESMVLTDLIWESVPQIEIFSIDTGRLFPETYDLIERLQQRYGRSIRMYYPQASDVEEWVSKNGINGFRDSLQQRLGCCSVRKVQPFRRAVSGYGAWVTGIRRGQSTSRAMASPFEWDAEYGLYKISPLLNWSESEIWDYIRHKQLPYNVLHDTGFPSIGCSPCTRAVKNGEDERAGRWWWEQAGPRECGLHPLRTNLPKID